MSANVVALLAAERIKLLSTRSPWWCAVVAIVLVGSFAALLAEFSPAGGGLGFTLVAAVQANLAAQLGLGVVMVMAAVAVTGDYRYGTIRVTFMVQPHRAVALLAKTVVVALAAALIGLATSFGTWGLIALLAPGADLALVTPERWRAVAGVGAVFAVGAAFAVAVGVLLRHAAAAIALVLIWVLVAEGLVSLIPVVGERIWRWLPFVNLNRFLTAGVTTGSGGIWASDQMPFGAWGSLAYAAAVVAALLAGALLVAHRRDA